jgi:prepilin-type N-terminal cleavage/methylation domain-containing protein
MRQRGLTLPETLAALVAFGVVTLSIATVHLERARAAPGITLREEAQRLAHELAEKIRVTRSMAVHYEDTVGVVCNRTATPTQPQLAANNEMACWQEKVRERLPNGEGVIASDTDSLTPAYLVTVSWSQPGARGASYVVRVPKETDAALP